MSPMVHRIAGYIHDRVPGCRDWHWPIALGFVHWHYIMGYLGTAMESPANPRILGVAIIRPVADPADGVIAYKHDPEGDCLFIDLFAADSPLAFTLLAETFAKRFGVRKRIAYNNHGHFVYRNRNRDTRMIVKDYHAFKRNVTRRKLLEPPTILGEPNGSKST